MKSGAVDGSLCRWEDISARYDWRTRGNGLSINVWPNFAYRALVEFADLLPRTMLYSSTKARRTLSSY